MKAQMKGLNECVNVVRFLFGRNKGFQRKWVPEKYITKSELSQNLSLSVKENTA